MNPRTARRPLPVHSLSVGYARRNFGTCMMSAGAGHDGRSIAPTQVEACGVGPSRVIDVEAVTLGREQQEQ